MQLELYVQLNDHWRMGDELKNSQIHRPLLKELLKNVPQHDRK